MYLKILHWSDEKTTIVVIKVNRDLLNLARLDGQRTFFILDEDTCNVCDFNFHQL